MRQAMSRPSRRTNVYVFTIYESNLNTKQADSLILVSRRNKDSVAPNYLSTFYNSLLLQCLSLVT